MPKYLPKTSSQKGFAPLLVIVAVVGLTGLSIAANLNNLNILKNSVSDVQGVFLARGGEDDGDEDRSGSNSGSSGRSGSEDSDSSGSSDSSNTPSTIQASITPQKSPKATSKPDRKQEKIEIKKVEKREVKKIEVKIEDELEDDFEEEEDELEDELEKLEVRIAQFKNRGGELEIEVEDATGSSRTLDSRKGREATSSGHGSNRGPSQNRGKRVKLQLEVKNATGEAKLEVEIESEDDGLNLVSRGAKARLNFPLSFNKQTGQLEVITGQGIKIIRILPDQAANQAFNSGIIDQLDDVELVDETNPNTSDDLAFKLKGRKDSTLFGFIPLSTTIETEVGAQTSNILSSNKPFWLKLLSPFIK